MNPLVSVIVPAYNHQAYVLETLQSIIAQTYRRIELLVLDDGSKDDTWKNILSMREACGRRFERVWMERQENRGLSASCSRMITEAKGDYIYIIASDDRALPTAIEKEAAFLETHRDYAMAVGDNVFIDAGGKRCAWGKHCSCAYTEQDSLYHSYSEFYTKKHHIDFLAEDYPDYKKMLLEYHVPHGYMIRRSTFMEQIGLFPPGIVCEDLWMVLQIIKYSKIKYLPEPLFEYRWHGGNQSSSPLLAKGQRDTLDYERELVKKIDLSRVRPAVLDFCQSVIEGREEFLPYRRKGIPWLYETRYSKRVLTDGKRRKDVRILGIRLRFG